MNDLPRCLTLLQGVLVEGPRFEAALEVFVAFITQHLHHLHQQSDIAVKGLSICVLVCQLVPHLIRKFVINSGLRIGSRFMSYAQVVKSSAVISKTLFQVSSQTDTRALSSKPIYQSHSGVPYS